jgi:hypothetical protein
MAIGMGWKGYLMGPPSFLPGINLTFFIGGGIRLLFIAVLSLILIL